VEEFIIDAGAATTVMAEEKYWRLREEGRAPPLTEIIGEDVAGVTRGQTAKVIGKVVSTVEFEGVAEDIEWTVVSNSNVRFLIGLPELGQIGFNIDCLESVWSVRGGKKRSIKVGADQVFVIDAGNTKDDEMFSDEMDAAVGAEKDDDNPPPLMDIRISEDDVVLLQMPEGLKTNPWVDTIDEEDEPQWGKISRHQDHQDSWLSTFLIPRPFQWPIFPSECSQRSPNPIIEQELS